MRRRTFIRRAGIASATAGVLGTSVAAAGKGRPGITPGLKRMLRNREFEKAHDVLDQRGADYAFSRTTAVPTDDGGVQTFQFDSRAGPKSNAGSDDVSAEAFLCDPDNGCGEFDLGVYDTADADEYYSFLYWDLDYANLAIDGPGPNDGAAISYSESVFRSVAGSQHKDDQSSNEDLHTHGYQVKFNDVRPYLINGQESGDGDVGTNNHGGSGDSHNEGWIGVTSEVRDGSYTGYVTVYSDFIHNWNPGGIPTNIGASFSLTSAGNFSVSYTGTADDWRTEDNVEKWVS